jgi:hypothetical protein
MLTHYQFVTVEFFHAAWYEKMGTTTEFPASQIQMSEDDAGNSALSPLFIRRREPEVYDNFAAGKKT